MNSDHLIRAAIGRLAEVAPTPPSWENVESRLAKRASRQPAPCRQASVRDQRLRRSLGVRRSRPAVGLAALIAVAVLAVPAVGAVREVASWLSGGKGPDAPLPLGPDVVLASGVSGVAWRIVATPSDQGLCRFLVVLVEDRPRSGLGGCGPSDVRGDPDAGERALHWVQGGNGTGGLDGLNRQIISGWAAEDVATVELALIDGGSFTAEIVLTPEGIHGPPKFFWAALLCRSPHCEESEPLVKSLVARDPAGTVLESRDVFDPKAGHAR